MLRVLSSANSTIRFIPHLPAMQCCSNIKSIKINNNNNNSPISPISSISASPTTLELLSHLNRIAHSLAISQPFSPPMDSSLGRKCPPIGLFSLDCEANHQLLFSIETKNVSIPQFCNQRHKSGDEGGNGMHELVVNASRSIGGGLGRTPTFCGERMMGRRRSRRKLLVLDLNGVLVDVICNVPPGYSPDIRIRRKAVFKRPSCDDFLKFCFERFDVGVWSSKVKKNVDDLVDFLMGDMKRHLLFCWDRSHCTETGRRTIENRHKPMVLKELKKLWYAQEFNLPWENGDYDISNTLLLDDSPYKALLNPPNTAIFPHAYTFKDDKDNSLGPGGDIRVYLERLHMAEDVQKFVEQNPFGKDFVANTSASSAYYDNIVNSLKFKDMHISSNWFQPKSAEYPCNTGFSSNLV
ncbi:hypothetical protein Sjap_014969 [Stephania japonica]|uniref:Mitochondrial import inner membrane translocase subunit TIM50 n=1 Tax=Stephania japonica TaxID=461633 RepID=A0AAP0IIJ4_9MAGN